MAEERRDIPVMLEEELRLGKALEEARRAEDDAARVRCAVQTALTEVQKAIDDALEERKSKAPPDSYWREKRRRTTNIPV